MEPGTVLTCVGANDGRRRLGMVFWWVSAPLVIWFCILRPAPNAPPVASWAFGAVWLVLAYVAARRVPPDPWVRVEAEGLAQQDSRGRLSVARWDQMWIADFGAPGRDGRAGGFTLCTRDAVLVSVPRGLERADELRQHIWQAGQFTSEGGPSASHWEREWPDEDEPGDEAD